MMSGMVTGETEPNEELREMLTTEQVLATIPISRTTLFRLEKLKLFPEGRWLTPHKKLWFKDRVVAWQRALEDPNSEVSKAVKARPKRRPRGKKS